MNGRSSNERPTKAAAESRVKTDRRILRTRDTLGDALWALMQEKRFEDIAVQEVLDRAGVGRSTFSAHYRDKEDLLLSDMEEFLVGFSSSLMRDGANAKRLAPVREFCTHVREAHEIHTALVLSGKMNEFQMLAQGIFARSIEERLQMAAAEADAVRRAAQAHALAGSLFALLDWWMDRGMKWDPEQMDDLFHSMAWNGLTAR